MIDFLHKSLPGQDVDDFVSEDELFRRGAAFVRFGYPYVFHVLSKWEDVFGADTSRVLNLPKIVPDPEQ